MQWIRRTLRALKSPSVSTSSERRRRPTFDCLEDRAVPATAGVISGSVFFDANQNGVNDGNANVAIGQFGEFAMGGVSISLTGATNAGTPVSSTVRTRADGSFQFTKLDPGVYQVRALASGFQAPNGFAGNLGGDAAANQVRTIIVGQGEVESNVRFGVPNINFDPGLVSLRLYFNTAIGNFNAVFKEMRGTPLTAGNGQAIIDGATAVAPVGTASLSGSVVRSGSATGIAGIQVQLLGVDNRGAPIFRTATTDASGDYRFTALPVATYFINVIPGSNFRAAGSTVGNLGGANPRADQLVPTLFTAGATLTGYNFSLAPFSGDLDAGLANDVGNGSLGTSTDRITSDPSIRGRLLNPSTYSRLEARFTGGATTDFASIRGSLAGDGSFLLNEQTMRDLFGGGLPDGNYAIEIRATSATGNVLTKSVSFTLQASGPQFLSPLRNQTSTAAGANTVVLLSGTFTDPDIANSVYTMKVMKGATPLDIHFELYDKDAPRAVANFLNYIDRYTSGDGTVFHRLDKNASFEVLQAGSQKFNAANDTITNNAVTADPPARNEYSSDFKNTRGTIGAARTNDPDSATTDFFFNLSNKNAEPFGINNNGGFTVFGKVLSEADLDVLDDLASVPVRNPGPTGGLPLVNGTTTDDNNVLRITQITKVSRDEELTYTATSSNTAVVTAAVAGFQGNQLTLDYQAAGTSTITVTATDKSGNTATTTFLVTVT